VFLQTRTDLRVTVYKDSDRYLALIADGWWMAYGTTAKQALKRVLKRYEREMRHRLTREDMRWNGLQLSVGL